MKIPYCKTKESTLMLQTTVDFLKVIAEENRLKILCMLREGEKCVCDIWQFLDLPQNLTSHHLKVLRDFGLVTDRKEGLKVFYSIDKKKIIHFNSLLHKYLQSYE